MSLERRKPRYVTTLAGLSSFKWVDGQLEGKTFSDAMKEIFTPAIMKQLIPEFNPLEALLKRKPSCESTVTSHTGYPSVQVSRGSYSSQLLGQLLSGK